MAAQSFPLRWSGVWEETSGPPGSTDHSGTPGDFLPIPVQIDSLTWTPDEPFLPTNEAQQYKHGYPDDVLGPRAATVNMTVPLHGSGLAGDDSVSGADEDDNALIRLLKIGMGGIDGANDGSTVASAASGSQITVGAGHGSRFSPGGAIGWVNSSGQLEIVPVASISTDTITTKMAFSATPSASDTIYNATTLYLDDGGSYAQFLVEGADADEYFSIRGAQLASIGIADALGQLPTIQLQWKAAEWARLGSGSLDGKTYANYKPFAYNGGALLAQTVGVATRQVISSPQVQIQPQVSYDAAMSAEGTNTILDWIQAHGSPVVQGSFQTYYGVGSPSTWWTAHTAGTAYFLAVQIGNANTRGVLIEMANVQIGQPTAVENIGGIAGMTVPFKGRLDTDATDQTTAERRSPLRFHFIN